VILLQSLTALQDALRLRRLVPEIWSGSLSLELCDLVSLTGRVKDASAAQQLA
jgi:hypothetical protein